MANGWNSGSDREAMLRRVAIVLSSLPGPVAADLLGEIDADTKKAVRRTMASLTDVDPLEQKRALHAFKISSRRVRPSSAISLRLKPAIADVFRAAFFWSSILPAFSTIAMIHPSSGSFGNRLIDHISRCICNCFFGLIDFAKLQHAK